MTPRPPPPLSLGTLGPLLYRVAVVAMCASAGADAVRAQGSAVQSALALTRVTVVDPAWDAPLGDATIVVQGERISAVGPRRAVAIPPRARVIDGSGRFVIPGLWDMHVHMAQPVAAGAGLEENAGYFLPLFLAHGVTGVRDMGGDLATLRRWSGEIARGSRVGPRIVFTGEKLGRVPVVPGAPFPLRRSRDVERSIQLLADSGAAFVKLHDIRPEWFGLLTREAWQRNLRVVGHVETAHSLRALARQGMRSIEHLDGLLLGTNRSEDSLRKVLLQQERASLWHRLLVRLGIRRRILYPEAAMASGYSPPRADSLYALFRSTGTWHCPTLRLLGALYRRSEPWLRVAPESLLLRPAPPLHNGLPSDPAPFEATHPLAAVYPQLARIVREMDARAVGLLAGTDTPGLFAVPGRSLHEELGLLVAAGLTPRAALRAATTGPADFLEARDSLGTIRPGAFADLVLLDSDPLSDIANTQAVRAVVARGRFFDRAALDVLIGQGARAASRLRGRSP
ncbi:MAG: amidohydrolase family protein [Gemmatimonadaceae bacterium]